MASFEERMHPRWWFCITRQLKPGQITAPEPLILESKPLPPPIRCCNVPRNSMHWTPSCPSPAATLKHLVKLGMGANTFRALAYNLGYLEVWCELATGSRLPWRTARRMPGSVPDG